MEKMGATDTICQVFGVRDAAKTSEAMKTELASWITLGAMCPEETRPSRAAILALAASSLSKARRRKDFRSAMLKFEG
eukprot:11832592-Heterocapsa_arctica.AAC.1